MQPTLTVFALSSTRSYPTELNQPIYDLIKREEVEEEKEKWKGGRPKHVFRRETH